MFSSVVGVLLEKYLGKYIEVPSSEKVDVSLSKGHAHLEQLRLRGHALSQLDLPLHVIHGTVGTLDVYVPWSSLRANSAEIHARNVFLLVRPRQKDEHDATEYEEELQKKKQSKLRRVTRAGLGDEEDAAPVKKEKDFLQRLMSIVKRNIQITITNIHIRFECEAHVPTTFLGGMTIGSVVTYPVDERWKKSFIEGDEVDETHRIIQFVNVTFYCNNDAPSFANLGFEQQMKAMELLIQRNSTGEEKHAGHHIVSPTTVTVKMKNTKLREADGSVTAKTNAMILCSHLKMYHTKKYLDRILEIVSYIRKFKSMRPYLKYRPKGSVMSNTPVSTLQWWRYAYTVVVQKRRRTLPQSWDEMKRVIAVRREYMLLYIRSVLEENSAVSSSQRMADMERLAVIERDQATETLIAFRKSAYRQFRRDTNAVVPVSVFDWLMGDTEVPVKLSEKELKQLQEEVRSMSSVSTHEREEGQAMKVTVLNEGDARGQVATFVISVSVRECSSNFFVSGRRLHVHARNLDFVHMKLKALRTATASAAHSGSGSTSQMRFGVQIIELVLWHKEDELLRAQIGNARNLLVSCADDSRAIVGAVEVSAGEKESIKSGFTIGAISLSTPKRNCMLRFRSGVSSQEFESVKSIFDAGGTSQFDTYIDSFIKSSKRHQSAVISYHVELREATNLLRQTNGQHFFLEWSLSSRHVTSRSEKRKGATSYAKQEGLGVWWGRSQGRTFDFRASMKYDAAARKFKPRSLKLVLKYKDCGKDIVCARGALDLARCSGHEAQQLIMLSLRGEKDKGSISVLLEATSTWLQINKHKIAHTVQPSAPKDEDSASLIEEEVSELTDDSCWSSESENEFDAVDELDDGVFEEEMEVEVLQSEIRGLRFALLNARKSGEQYRRQAEQAQAIIESQQDEIRRLRAQLSDTGTGGNGHGNAPKAPERTVDSRAALTALLRENSVASSPAISRTKEKKRKKRVDRPENDVLWDHIVMAGPAGVYDGSDVHPSSCAPSLKPVPTVDAEASALSPFPNKRSSIISRPAVASESMEATTGDREQRGEDHMSKNMTFVTAASSHALTRGSGSTAQVRRSTKKRAQREQPAEVSLMEDAFPCATGAGTHDPHEHARMLFRHILGCGALGTTSNSALLCQILSGVGSSVLKGARSWGVLSYYLSMTCALLHQLQSQPSLGTREDIENGIHSYDQGGQRNLKGLALLVSHTHPSQNDGDRSASEWFEESLGRMAFGVYHFMYHTACEAILLSMNETTTIYEGFSETYIRALLEALQRLSLIFEGVQMQRSIQEQMQCGLLYTACAYVFNKLIRAPGGITVHGAIRIKYGITYLEHALDQSAILVNHEALKQMDPLKQAMDLVVTATNTSLTDSGASYLESFDSLNKRQMLVLLEGMKCEDGSSVSAELVLMLREMAAGCLGEEESLPLYMLMERRHGADSPCYYSEFMSYTAVR